MEFTISLPFAVFLFVVLGMVIAGVHFTIKNKNLGELICFLMIGCLFGGIGYGVTFGAVYFIEQSENDRKIFATMQQPWKDLRLYLNKTDNSTREKRTIKAFEEKYYTCVEENWDTNCNCSISISPEQAEMFKRTVGENDRWKVRNVLEKCIQINLADELATAKKE